MWGEWKSWKCGVGLKKVIDSGENLYGVCRKYV